MRWIGTLMGMIGLVTLLALPALTEGEEPVVTIQSGTVVACAAFSPGGERLALGCMNGAVQVYSTESWQIVWEEVVSDQGQVSTIAFSPDGEKLGASLAGEPAVLLLDAGTGREIRRIELGGEFTAIESMAFSPDGELLACADTRTAADDIRVMLVDPDTGQELGTPIQLQLCCWALPFEVAFSHDGRFLVGGGFGRIVVWDIEAEEETQHLSGTWFRPGYFDGIALSADGKLIAASGYGTSKVLLWDTETWQSSTLAAAGSNTAGVSVAFDLTGRLLGAGYEKYMIWDVESRSLLWSESASRRGTTWIGFSPDGQLFAGVPFSKGTVTVWSVSDLIGE
jgi:WD40 repeat protein